MLKVEILQILKGIRLINKINLKFKKTLLKTIQYHPKILIIKSLKNIWNKMIKNQKNVAHQSNDKIHCLRNKKQILNNSNKYNIILKIINRTQNHRLYKQIHNLLNRSIFNQHSALLIKQLKN